MARVGHKQPLYTMEKLCLPRREVVVLVGQGLREVEVVQEVPAAMVAMQRVAELVLLVLARHLQATFGNPSSMQQLVPPAPPSQPVGPVERHPLITLDSLTYNGGKNPAAVADVVAPAIREARDLIVLAGPIRVAQCLHRPQVYTRTDYARCFFFANLYNLRSYSLPLPPSEKKIICLHLNGTMLVVVGFVFVYSQSNQYPTNPL